MPVTQDPVLVDPEIASITFESHLNQMWDTGRPAAKGWERRTLDPMTTIVRMPARRACDTVDHYHVKLGAQYYDSAPPTVEFVEPDTWTTAAHGSKWFPVIEPKPPWFGLHHSYTYRDGTQRQLVCFSFNANYYMTKHSPKETELWQQGRHTVSATLSRLAEVLSPPWYRGPSS